MLRRRRFDDIDDIRIRQRQLWRPFHKINSKIVLVGELRAGVGA
jgi:hypothetical protein